MKYTLNIKGAHKDIHYGHLNMHAHTKNGGKNPEGDIIDFNSYSMTVNDKPFFAITGEFHYSRYDRAFWEEEIMKMKACGLNIISTYIFWIHHEEEEGIFDFAGNNDVGEFIRLCNKHGLKVVLRIGPYAHGECRNGGLPDWMFGRPWEVRTNAPEYLKYVERYFDEIGRQVSGLMYKDGGPIVGIQLENEFMAACSPWEVTVSQQREWVTHGAGGVAHMEKLRELAFSAGIEPAFVTVTGWGDAPYVKGEMLPLWGGYAFWPWLFWDDGNSTAEKVHPPTYSYLFANEHCETAKNGEFSLYPFACCEMGGGMQVWYNYRFTVPPESVEAMALTTVANGCNFLGYFMFHGGCNPIGKCGYLNEQFNPRISYDFEAPLGEFGRVKESYKRIKLLHYFMEDYSAFLCNTPTILPETVVATPENLSDLRFAARSDGQSGFVFIGNYQDHLEQTDKNDVSISITANNNDEIIIPHTGGMCIPKDVACVLPFCMDMDGISLRYATAQYITRLETTEETAWFFFVHDGMAGEFCFEHDVKPDLLEGSEYVQHDGMGFVTVVGGEISRFSFDGNRRTTVYVLNREASLGLHRLTIGGEDLIAISRAALYTDGTHLFAETRNNHESVAVYPASVALESEALTSAGLCSGMAMYNISLPQKPAKLSVTKTYDNRAIIRFDTDILADASEVYLRTDYLGDIGWAFINGHLIHDNFYNGETWEIGLKRFARELCKHELYLYISPIHEGASMSMVENLAARVETFEKTTAEIIDVGIEIEQTVKLLVKST